MMEYTTNRPNRNRSEPQATAPFCPHVDPCNDDPREFRRLVRVLGFRGASALWGPTER